MGMSQQVARFENVTDGVRAFVYNGRERGYAFSVVVEDVYSGEVVGIKLFKTDEAARAFAQATVEGRAL